MSHSLKGQIEAVLFLTGRALSVHDIAERVGAEAETVEFALLELINDYASREEGALEIDDADGYILQVKDDYSAVVNKMVPVDLSIGALRTLAAIAINGPFLQSELVTLRGANAYDHIKELVAHRLVSKKRKDKSFTLNVTPQFHEYFKLTGDKNELKAWLSQLPVQDDVKPLSGNEFEPLLSETSP